MDKFSLVQERKPQFGRGRLKKFKRDKSRMEILHAGKTGIENDIVGIGNQGGI